MHLFGRPNDLRKEVLRALARGIEPGQAPPESDMWHERWAQFSDLEKATWQAVDKAKRKLRGSVASARATGWPVRWDDDDRARFDCIAHETQLRLGVDEPRYKPASYGNWWLSHDGGLDWYEWMHAGRSAAHQECLDAIAEIGPTSVMDVGCGFGVGYADALSDRTFVGVDMVPDAIAYCQSSRPGTYYCADLLAPHDLPKCEFVFSSGTIDNSWDMTTYLAAIASLATRAVHITAYRGWFPELEEHRYMWIPDTTAYYNDVAPTQLITELRRLGFSRIDVSPLPTGRPEPQPSHETRILAVR